MFISLDNLILLCALMVDVGFIFGLSMLFFGEKASASKKQQTKSSFKPRRRYYLNLSRK